MTPSDRLHELARELRRRKLDWAADEVDKVLVRQPAAEPDGEALAQRINTLLESLADQQAMPDDSWRDRWQILRTELDAVLGRDTPPQEPPKPYAYMQQGGKLSEPCNAFVPIALAGAWTSDMCVRCYWKQSEHPPVGRRDTPPTLQSAFDALPKTWDTPPEPKP